MGLQTSGRISQLDSWPNWIGYRATQMGNSTACEFRSQSLELEGKVEAEPTRATKLEVD